MRTAAYPLFAIAAALGALPACASVPPVEHTPRTQVVRPSSVSLPAPLVIAVLYFEDRTHLPALAWLRKGLADMLITDLSQAPGIQVVQRERLEDLMREQMLQAGGRVEEKTAVRIGRITGATVMLLGSAVRIRETLRLDAHLLDVERGTVLGAVSVEGRTAEVLALEKQLAARILTLLQTDSAMRAGMPLSPSLVPSRTAAEALYQGLDAADRGNLPEALTKFEAAMDKQTQYAEAQRRYEGTVRRMDGNLLWSRAIARDGSSQDRLRLGARLADDLFREGLLAEVERVGDSIFRIQIRFDDQAVQSFRQEITSLGGLVTEQEGRLIIGVEPPEIRAAFARALAVPRRAFLHVQGSDGRQVAIYSQLKPWDGKQWLFFDADGRLVVEIGQRLAQTLSLESLPVERLSPPVRLWVSLDPVPREQAIIQVELVGTTENGREILLSPRPGGNSRPAEGMQLFTWLEVDQARSHLVREIEQLWNPPVWERIPGPGYLPSARRSVMVVALLEHGKMTPPQLIGSSGDPLSDGACVSAVQGLDRNRLEAPLAELEKSDAIRTIRVRVYCELVKDIPSLHEGMPGSHRQTPGNPRKPSLGPS